MPDLIAKSPLDGTPPLSLGDATLSEVPPGRITSVAPLKGGEKALRTALKAMGLGFPAPNRFLAKGDARIVWTGRDQAFLIGGDPAGLGVHAALTDQSDGWATLRIEGEAAADVLARLLPIDLRPAAFPAGHAARTPLNHMASVVMRTAPRGFEIMMFRSMAHSAWHELHEAMKSVSARRRLR